MNVVEVCLNDVVNDAAVTLKDVTELLSRIDAEDDWVELEEMNGRCIYIDVELLLLKDVVVKDDDYVL